MIGSDDPDLSAFARSGGKPLSWHGQADQLVPHTGHRRLPRARRTAAHGGTRIDLTADDALADALNRHQSVSADLGPANGQDRRR